MWMCVWEEKAGSGEDKSRTSPDGGELMGKVGIRCNFRGRG